MADTNDRNFALPMNSYKFRVLEAEKQISQKGNPMIVCELELIDNPEAKTKDGSRDINGRRLRHFATLAPKGLGLLNTFRKSIGLDAVTEADLPNQESAFYEGKTGYAVIKGTAEEMKNQETGELIINPHTQKPEISYRMEVVRWQVPV